MRDLAPAIYWWKKGEVGGGGCRGSPVASSQHNDHFSRHLPMLREPIEHTHSAGNMLKKKKKNVDLSA